MQVCVDWDEWKVLCMRRSSIATFFLWERWRVRFVGSGKGMSALDGWTDGDMWLDSICK